MKLKEIIEVLINQPKQITIEDIESISIDFDLENTEIKITIEELNTWIEENI